MLISVYCVGLTPKLTGAGARSAEGTNTGHENAEGMACVGVRVEPPVSHYRAAQTRLDNSAINFAKLALTSPSSFSNVSLLRLDKVWAIFDISSNLNVMVPLLNSRD